MSSKGSAALIVISGVSWDSVIRSETAFSNASLKSSKAFVYTSTVPTLKSFIRQRQRWTSKSTVYTDWQVIFTACTVFLVSLIQIALLAFSIYDLLYLYLFAVVFIMSLLYPFYIVVVAITGLMSKPTWK